MDGRCRAEVEPARRAIRLAHAARRDHPDELSRGGREALARYLRRGFVAEVLEHLRLRREALASDGTGTIALHLRGVRESGGRHDQKERGESLHPLILLHAPGGGLPNSRVGEARGPRVLSVCGPHSGSVRRRPFTPSTLGARTLRIPERTRGPRAGLRPTSEPAMSSGPTGEGPAPRELFAASFVHFQRGVTGFPGGGEVPLAFRDKGVVPSLSEAALAAASSCRARPRAWSRVRTDGDRGLFHPWWPRPPRASRSASGRR